MRRNIYILLAILFIFFFGFLSRFMAAEISLTFILLLLPLIVFTTKVTKNRVGLGYTTVIVFFWLFFIVAPILQLYIRGVGNLVNTMNYDSASISFANILNFLFVVIFDFSYFRFKSKLSCIVDQALLPEVYSSRNRFYINTVTCIALIILSYIILAYGLDTVINVFQNKFHQAGFEFEDKGAWGFIQGKFIFFYSAGFFSYGNFILPRKIQDSFYYDFVTCH